MQNQFLASSETRMSRLPMPFLRYLAILLLIFLLILPIITFLLNAFAFRWFYPQLMPQEWSLQAWERLRLVPPVGERSLGNWLRLLGADSEIGKAMITSLVLGSGVTLVSLIIGIPAARVLGKHEFRGKRLVEFIILAPTIVPVMTFSLGINVNFIRWKLTGTLLAVGLVHLVPVLPYVVLTLSGVFANYNPEFEEQARTLGAGSIRTFRYVTLPMIFPGIIVAALFAFLVSWNQYLLTFLIGGGSVITMPVLLFSTISGGNNPLIAAMSLVFVAPTIFILLLTSRYLSRQPSVTRVID